jgi:hypothetical protein
VAAAQDGVIADESFMTTSQMLFTLAHCIQAQLPWRDQADVALSSAAVPRVGLGPSTPPLCRCAERPADLILRVGCAGGRRNPNPVAVQQKLYLPWCSLLSPYRSKPTSLAAGEAGVRGAAWTWGFAKSGGAVGHRPLRVTFA